MKDRLRRYSDLLDEIDMQERRLDQMRADMGGVRSPSCDGMPKGACDPDGVHRKAMVAMRLEDAIEAARLREEAERADGLEAAGFERGVRRPSDDAVAEAVSRVDAAAADYGAALVEAVEMDEGGARRPVLRRRPGGHDAGPLLPAVRAVVGRRCEGRGLLAQRRAHRREAGARVGVRQDAAPVPRPAAAGAVTTTPPPPGVGSLGPPAGLAPEQRRAFSALKARKTRLPKAARPRRRLCFTR